MRTKGTKEIVATADGQGFVALFENGELWRHNTMTHTWVRVLTPEEMDTRSKITPRSEAERLAEEDKRFEPGSHYRNPRSVDMDQGYEKPAEAPRTASETTASQSYATVSVSQAERSEALSYAHRMAGGVATMDHALKLARWVIAKFERREQ
jgi:hypothetical protein